MAWEKTNKINILFFQIIDLKILKNIIGPIYHNIYEVEVCVLFSFVARKVNCVVVNNMYVWPENGNILIALLNHFHAYNKRHTYNIYIMMVQYVLKYEQCGIITVEIMTAQYWCNMF